jgi:hypothetical protein
VCHVDLISEVSSLGPLQRIFEPSFLLTPLDRFETSLLLLGAVIPRNVFNLWITMGLVIRAPKLGAVCWIVSSSISRNMQETNEVRLLPLLVVAPSLLSG